MNTINDPSHKTWLEFSRDDEKLIIDTPVFQRLRRIKQLTAAHYVFPSGVHTRFAHSIGVMNIAGQYAEKLYKDHPEKEHKVKLARLCGLLHDGS
jgi:HD superfamily phosphohydrolase